MVLLVVLVVVMGGILGLGLGGVVGGYELIRAWEPCEGGGVWGGGGLYVVIRERRGEGIGNRIWWTAR